MMKAGTYYVGDLCYVMNDEEWREVCDLTTSGNECLEGEFQLADGRRFAMYGTKFGDGTYRDFERLYEFSVDSGTIGCILLSDIKANKYDDIEQLGAVITFQSDFVTGGGNNEKDWEGVIQFGRIGIETDPDGGEWESDEDYEYED